MRPKGNLNTVTKDVRAIAQGMLNDPEYVAGLIIRLRSGVAPHIETLLWHYAYGRPQTRIELSGPAGKALQVHLYIPNNHRSKQVTGRDDHGAPMANGNGALALNGTADTDTLTDGPATATDDAATADESTAASADATHTGDDLNEAH